MAESQKRRYGTVGCEVAGCARPHSTRGLCNAHYKRLRKHGTISPRFRGEVVDGKRICPRCKKDRPLSEWGAADRCKACNSANALTYYASAPRSTLQCRACGATFEGTKRQSATCSEPCRRAYKAACDSEYQKANIGRAAVAKRRWVEANRDKVAEKEQRRRARKRGATVGPIDLGALWTGACGICNDLLNPELRHPDPLSRSLDHIIPLAKGGMHTQENLQWSHLGCNVRKGARLLKGAA